MKNYRNLSQSLVAGLSLIFFSLLSFSHSTALSAEIPLVRSLEISPVDFEAYARARNRVSSAEALSRVLSTDERITRLLERSQEAWLNGSVTVARTLFRKMTELAFESDWSTSEQEALHYAFMRLAQSADSEVERDDWLKKAVAFDVNASPDASLFPPPLVERYRTLRTGAMAHAREIRLDRIFPDHRVIRINGRTIDISSKQPLRLPSGRYRLSAFSDTHSPIAEVLDLPQLVTYQPRSQILVAGDCKHPMDGDGATARLAEIDVLYKDDCLRRRTSAGWSDQAATKKGDKLELKNLLPSTSQTRSTADHWPQSPAPAKPLVRNPWIWVGATTLFAGAVYLIQKEQKSNGQPPKVDPVLIPIHKTY